MVCIFYFGKDMFYKVTVKWFTLRLEFWERVGEGLKIYNYRRMKRLLL
jgi:hypothetical protein